MSSQDIDVQKAIQMLDSVLGSIQHKVTLYTCGGTALIYLGYDGRRTSDVDVIATSLEPEVQKAAVQVAKKLKINPDWLNTKVTPLGDRLGKGWKKKCTTLFQGDAVTLKVISRQDLINSKVHAAVDRQSADYTDVLWLKPSLKELGLAKEYTLKQNYEETYERFVNYYIQELKNDLGLK